MRLPRKNVRPLGGRPLVNYVLATLNASSVSETVLYAGSEEILGFVESGVQCSFVQRPSSLDADGATVQDFVGAFLDDVPCDVVVLLHITSPFMSTATVDACIDAVASGRHESAFAAIELKRFAWFRGQPLNYQLEQPTPRTQDLEPVLVEQSGLYVFTRDLFERTGRRIADDPYVRVVDAVEGHDIDTADEFDLAEAILSMAPER